MSAASAICTRNLIKRFRSVEALRGLDLDVPLNSVYALVGPNGAGKTTAIKILMNILRPTGGSAEVLGKSSASIAGTDFESIGYVSENQDLPDGMRVGGLLAYLRPFYPAWDRQLEAELVTRFNLPVDRKLKALSRGMQMKAALACSLAYRPRLLVLDEPFSGLDPLVRDELIQCLRAREGETTVFISSHDLAEVENLATHVGFLESGRLLFSEQLSVLSDRFRQVEVTLEKPAPARDAWPVQWLQVEVSGNTVRFVDSEFDGAIPGKRIRAELNEVRDCSFTPMSLRSIFLAVARSKDARKAQEERA